MPPCHSIAIDEKQPEMSDGIPEFEWSPGNKIIFDNEHNKDEENEEVTDDDDNIMDLNIEEANENDEISINNDESENEAVVINVTDKDESDLSITESESSSVNNAEETNISNDSSDESNISYDSTDIDEDVIASNKESIVIEEDNEDEPNNSIETVSDDEYIEPSDEDMTPNEMNNDRPTRSNAGQGVKRLEMKFGGKSYEEQLKSQFAQTKMKLQSKRWSKRKRIRHAVQLLSHARNKSTPNEYHEKLNVAMHVMCTQMSAKRGIKLFGEEAVAAIYKEYKQLDEGAKKGNPVVTPTPKDSLTEEEKRKALEAVTLIKQKRCGKIKGRCAANGSKQRQYLKPEESVASPTCSLEGLIATLVIDAYEGRKVNTFDVPGAFLQAPMPEGKKVLLKLRGDFVDIMCRVNPEHLPNIMFEGKEKVLYLRVERAIYGCIESALQWYIMFTEVLEKEGFKLNPYDKCVANKMINGKQCTIVWYVDDVKISHMSQKVLDEITKLMQEKFGPMDIITGDEHSYLGMNITIHRKRKVVEIEMKQQLLETIEAYKGIIKDNDVKSPAAKHVFDTRDSVAKKLDKDMAENFHHVTAKLLHIMKRARPDIEIPIVFLCTRVRDPDEDDLKKLERVLEWIQKTINETRFIGADDLHTLFTWINAAYAVHPNMRSHTGGAMSMGTGVMHCKSGRQKLNTRSSTESELVGASDYMPYAIWLMYFMKEQGYELTSNVLFQDNQSAMKMERNGRNSCTGNSRHVNIRYFWLKDRIDKGEVDLRYCETERMLADFYTKALQGASFMKFWYVLMGHKPISSLFENEETSNLDVKERDGNTNGSEIEIGTNEKE